MFFFCSSFVTSPTKKKNNMSCYRLNNGTRPYIGKYKKCCKRMETEFKIFWMSKNDIVFLKFFFLLFNIANIYWRKKKKICKQSTSRCHLPLYKNVYRTEKKILSTLEHRTKWVFKRWAIIRWSPAEHTISFKNHLHFKYVHRQRHSVSSSFGDIGKINKIVEKNVHATSNATNAMQTKTTGNAIGLS